MVGSGSGVEFNGLSLLNDPNYFSSWVEEEWW
jgi:hypothetical protein